MTTNEALTTWNDACAAGKDGIRVWMDGNREPLAVALSKHPLAEIELTELPAPRSDWRGVVKVTDAGETEATFYLCVQ